MEIKKILPFKCGQVVATPAALAALERNGQSGSEFLNRHIVGDYGEICKEDAEQNDSNFENGKDLKKDRIHSAYSLKDGAKIWIITEWTREVTTVLLPDDY